MSGRDDSGLDDERLPTGDALVGALSRATATFEAAVVRAAGSDARVDLSGLPGAAQALFLSRLQAKAGVPLLVVVADTDDARRVASDLSQFSRGVKGDDTFPDDGAPLDTEAGAVLVLPAPDASPFSEAAADRRAVMERLAVLFHLVHELPFRFLVAPAAALARRVPPKDALRARSRVVRAETEIDQTDLVRALSDGGYLRVPAVEDPGTFSVRGALVDVYPSHARFPVRIELDDWLVLSIKRFDPQDQRTIEAVREIAIPPVRETLASDVDRARAKERVRELCDAIDLPTRTTKALLDDLESGRPFPGVEAFLPAFFSELVSPLEYLPAGHRVAVLDASATARALESELETARLDRDAKVRKKSPTFPLEALYATEHEVAEALAQRQLAVVHRLAVGAGELDDDESHAIARLEHVDPDRVLELAGEGHELLVSTLAAQRLGTGKDDALAPLAARATEWLDSGFRVVFSARTRTQAERLVSLLRGYSVPTAGKPEVFRPDRLRARATARGVEVVVADVSAGFSIPSLALAWVTEEEIFGTRAHRRREKKRKPGQGAKAFFEDLAALEKGDFVVHVDHGVGKYLGLEKKRLGLSKGEELLGKYAAEVEVLVVEYAGGDRLFLPVTRLHQITKYATAEGQSPKIDRLGGQSFQKTKAKAKKHVQEMADELLRLYAQRAAARRPALPAADRSYAEFEATFPFEETTDQARAIDEVLGDLEGQQPMDRIVCGDVGFGKTEVAIRAAFRVAMAGRQAAILCPTTVLAQQHHQTFSARMQGYPLRVEMLSRFVDAEDSAKVMAGLKDGTVDVVIGTHRLLSKDIHFKDLGLLVVDEEQRFGVTHKERIKKIRAEVDVLTLTATPIPRTLQLAVGGLRDLSLISTPPTDRRAVRTYVTRWDDHLVKEAISREVARGGQVFFVYNRIEGLYERAAKLQLLVPDARFAVAHGQMGEAALEQTMTDFVAGKYDVLCATAIIESGLDIPRANTMVIDRADTFGLAQLYQLRGRVGRSKERAYCYLVVPPAAAMTDEARARIEALERFSELGAGFQVASLDMELRGAGDVLGTEQSGTVAAVGFELFLRMLEEAVAELRGEPLATLVDTELTIDVPLFLPDDYVEDVGLRLSFYKRFAAAESESEVEDVASEMQDRFGPPPTAAMTYVRAMRLRPPLRLLRVLGCEATRERVTLHLKEDTLLDPAKVMAKVAAKSSPWKLTPDMKLTRRFPTELAGEALDRVEQLIRELADLRKEE